jgi:uncharacterized protein
MRFLVFILLILQSACALKAQTYADSIAEFRKEYIKELLADKRAPVKPAQVKNISFYDADKSYCVVASFTETPGSVPFMVPTHSGKSKPFREYGTLSFSLPDGQFELHVYQSVDLINDAAHKDELFLPFNDFTNYEATYGGGRYIDLSIKDIKDGKVVLDFNKCYNPYCAYADGYSCPIPPVENRLKVDIKAGEKAFQH